jgi:protocatechuate 3,4-dioxygenase beta subunit
LPKEELSRRLFTFQALALAALAACDKAGPADTSETDDPGDTDPAVDTDDTDVADTDTTDTDDTDVPTSDWASGGAAVIGDDYPDPFTAPSSCAMFCAMTLGPCWTEAPERRDVSEGVAGLPMRLALRVLDEECNPVVGAVVDIWHTAPNGRYSGEDTATMCTGGDEEAEAALWFRGTQTTDASGRVDFDSCFPGWYSGRAIHIHFQVRKGDTAWVTSQLFFPQALVDEVFAAHPDYLKFGTPNTSNASDGIFAAADDPDAYVVAYARMDDGVMQAFKDIVLRSSLETDLCSA